MGAKNSTPRQSAFHPGEERNQCRWRLALLTISIELIIDDVPAYFGFIECGKGKDRCVAGAPVTANREGSLEAAYTGHRYVHDNDVGAPCKACRNRVGPTTHGLAIHVFE